MMIKISIPHDKIEAFCRKHHIRRMQFFGSVLREDFGPESDIDVLVEFEPEARITLFDLVDMQDELSLLFGRPIDIMTPDSLYEPLRENILSSAEVVYAPA